MKAKQKTFALIIVIMIASAAILAICYFIPKTFLSGVKPSDVKSISVFDGNTGNMFVIENQEEIEYIVKNVQSIKMKRSKVSIGYVGYTFRISFNGDNSKVIDSFIINSSDTIRDDPFFYSCTGGLCFDYLKELEEQYAK